MRNKGLVFVGFLWMFAIGLWTSALWPGPASEGICAPVAKMTPERSPECLTLLQNTVGEVMNRRYGRWLVTPGPTEYYFWSEAKSEVYREIHERPGVSGFTREYKNANPDVVVLYSTEEADFPVELVLAHEITHVFQITNQLDASEIEARDVSIKVWLRLFYEPRR